MLCPQQVKSSSVDQNVHGYQKCLYIDHAIHISLYRSILINGHDSSPIPNNATIDQ